MNFCVHITQDESIAEKAKYLNLDIREIEHCFNNPNVGLLDAAYRYPDSLYIIQVPFHEVIDWNQLETISNAVGKNRIILCLASTDYFAEAKARGFMYFYGYPVNNMYDARALKELGVCMLKVEGQLFFDMDNLKRLDVPIVVEANSADFSLIPKSYTWCGSWIRPEDVEMYEGYVHLITFKSENPIQEATLFKYYAEKHKWEGKLDVLVHDLVEENVHNWMINPDQMRERLNCKQRCQNGWSCNICSFNFKMAQKGDQIEEFINRLKKSKEENNNGEGSAK